MGLVLGLEMSRLARAGRDWHQLIELCSLAGALLVDADGVTIRSGTTTRLALGDDQPASLPVDVIQRQGRTSGTKAVGQRQQDRVTALAAGGAAVDGAEHQPTSVREMDSGI